MISTSKGTADIWFSDSEKWHDGNYLCRSRKTIIQRDPDTDAKTEVFTSSGILLILQQRNNDFIQDGITLAQKELFTSSGR